MDPQDIALAQQAGFLGPQPPVVGPSPMPEADPLGVDRPNPFGPVLTPQLGEADLSFLPPLPGEEMQPAQPEPPTSTTKSSSTATSSSSSERGFSGEKFKQVRKGPGGELRRDLANIPGQVEQRYAGMQAEGAGIAQQLSHAETMGNEAQLGQLAERGKSQEDIALIERNFMWKMKAAQENAALESQAAMMKHRAAVEDWAASNVNPGAIFDQAGGFNSFGMGVAAFVHDFLGAKGVKTSAMDTFNRAQEMNIQAQVENIRKKGQVASAFKELWENVRLQSATEQEAMTRLHGYSLRAAEAQLTADMGKYDSKLAQAKHLAALQEIRKARLKNDMDLQAHMDKEISDSTKQRIDIYQIETQAAQAAAARAHASKEAELLRNHQLKMAQTKTEAPKRKRQVIDPLTNRGILRFKEGVSDTEQAKVTEMVAKYEPAAQKIKEMRELARKAGASNDAFKGTRLDTEDRRLLHASALEFAHQMLAATGERATDKDIEQMMKSLEFDTTLTRGHTGKILANFEAHLHKKMKGYTRQYLEDTPLEEQETGSMNVLNEDAKLESEASAHNTVPKADDPKNAVGYAKYAIAKPDSFTPIAEDSLEKLSLKNGTQGLQKAFNDFQKSPQGLNFEHYATVGQGTKRKRESTALEDVAAGVTGGGDVLANIEGMSNKPDVAFAHLYRLWEKAPKDEDARAALAAYASYDDGKNEVDPDLTTDQKQLLDDYATFLLNSGAEKK